MNFHLRTATNKPDGDAPFKLLKVSRRRLVLCQAQMRNQSNRPHHKVFPFGRRYSAPLQMPPHWQACSEINCSYRMYTLIRMSCHVYTRRYVMFIWNALLISISSAFVAIQLPQPTHFKTATVYVWQRWRNFQKVIFFTFFVCLFDELISCTRPSNVINLLWCFHGILHIAKIRLTTDYYWARVVNCNFYKSKKEFSAHKKKREWKTNKKTKENF